MYWLIPATQEHVKALVSRVAEEDAKEAVELDGEDVETAISRGIRESEGDAQAGGVDNKILFIAGVRPVSLLPTIGCAWMIGAHDLPEHATAFLRMSKKWVAERQKRYDLLVNYVAAWYERSLRWLCWLGFEKIEPPVRLGKSNSLWYRVELKGRD